MSSHDDRERSTSNTRKLKGLMLKSDNRICADCGAPDPKWASSNIGVFICMSCSGVHRNLGTHISKVLSVTLDKWSDEQIDSMIEVGGNSYANTIYEAFLPEGYPKPNAHSSYEERAEFIRAKYERQEFLKPGLRILPSKTSSNPEHNNVCSESSSNAVGMVEFIGILIVKVIKGTNLAIRDVRSSDPYVVLMLGQQKAKTSVIKSNLNPVWNQELKLSVSKNYGALKVQIFDNDLISSDDLMGEAEVDLQPMITAAMAFGDPDLLTNMQIGKWLQSNDNALTKDSIINIVDGKVKQEVSLKLQKAECGEIDLELEWISLTQ
ncbi:ADP-ribosylation factor GTPase-activating protein AGD12-like isoform X1 [Zingiber officinale]|uniref:ADP-ribosylation factor GTPase-activating protein AGD12-like n=2 Tax=Zingiber officinale TaxID=94328 RepID=A0A8J5KT80_ZINOF|nr:ADP-ribosylation factor GTPase-activating protein AGD12-like isoform X1 [Zingiber officinale]KAG6494342.1 hypothetical protein ZIOFF_049366 [Zingiber officinale]